MTGTAPDPAVTADRIVGDRREWDAARRWYGPDPSPDPGRDYAGEFVAARVAAITAPNLSELDAAHDRAEGIRRAARAAGVDLDPWALDRRARASLR